MLTLFPDSSGHIQSSRCTLLCQSCRIIRHTGGGGKGQNCTDVPLLIIYKRLTAITSTTLPSSIKYFDETAADLHQKTRDQGNAVIGQAALALRVGLSVKFKIKDGDRAAVIPAQRRRDSQAASQPYPCA